MTDISSRKTDHIDLVVQENVGFRQTTTLFECVRLVHDALPELALEDIDLGTTVLKKRLKAPILIAAMTGGAPRAEHINRELAEVAEERGYAFGLGSQRAMLRKPELLSTYAVRSVAPTALLLGNIGIVQARSMSTQELADLAGAIGADALCIHLNPAMELVQPEGDRDFQEGLATVSRLVTDLGLPIVVKETGCGISKSVAARLRAAGVAHLDVSGAGGTSWVAVETFRAANDQRDLGEAFWDWGIPTAASVAMVAPYEFETVFATGGMKSGIDIAKAIALGATVGGIARPVLQALVDSGKDGARSFLMRLEAQLRTAFLLTGSRHARELRRKPRLVTGELAQWLELRT